MYRLLIFTLCESFFLKLVYNRELINKTNENEENIIYIYSLYIPFLKAIKRLKKTKKKYSLLPDNT